MLPLLFAVGEIIADIAVGAAIGAGVTAGAMAVGAAIAVVIEGIIDKFSIQEKMPSVGVNSFLVDTINNSQNQVKLIDLETEDEYVYTGDGISDEIYEGQVIYA